jgi:hypothetical protein
VTKPPQKPWTGKDKMDEETQRELRRKKLCYSCKEPWESVTDVWEKVKSII